MKTYLLGTTTPDGIEYDEKITNINALTEQGSLLILGANVDFDGGSGTFASIAASKNISAYRFIKPQYETKDLQKALFLIQLVYVHQQHHLFPSGQAVSDAQLDYLLRHDVVNEISRFRSIIHEKPDWNNVGPPRPDLDVIALDFCNRDFFEYELRSQKVISKAGFVLVAGGLGERLGATQIKVSLPTESLTGECFLSVFLKHLQKYNNPPLFIMTSLETHQKTIDLLNTLLPNQNWQDFITLALQNNVPSFENAEGKLAIKPGTSFPELVLKPHGHGDVHSLLEKHCSQQWQARGVEYVCFFQDTNPNCFRVLPCLLGVLETHSELSCVIACVPRIPKSATGCLARDLASNSLVNVEYNIMNQYLINHPQKDAEFNCANTNQFICRYAPYQQLPNKKMPEFCNPKLVKNSSTFQSPARLECLMQDVLKLLVEPNKSPEDKKLKSDQCDNRTKVVLFQDFKLNKARTHVLYAPAKNSKAVAETAWKAGTTDGSPASSEAAVYAANCGLLHSLGCIVEHEQVGVVIDDVIEINPLWPAVVFDPRLMPYYVDAKRIFLEPENVIIAGNSSLELRGEGTIRIKKLVLKGSLIIWAKGKESVIEIDEMVVENSGRVITIPSKNEVRISLRHGDDVKLIQE